MSWRQRFGCQSSRKSGSAGSPVESRRKSARSSRNASPDRRAARTAVEPPVARSYSSSPSTTLIVVSNDVRVEPLARSQFQPPSGCRSPSRRSTIGRDVDAEVGAVGDRAAVDALLDLALPERLAALVPAGVLADQRHRGPGARRGGVEAELAELAQREVGGRPGLALRLPRLAGEAGRHERPAGPLAVRVAMREQPRAPALGLDAGALRRPFGLGRVHEVAHDLPADRRVRVEQPVDDGVGRGHGRRDSPGRRAFNRPAGAAAVGRLEPRPASVYRAGLPNREHNETPWPPAFVARGARPARGEAT